MTPIKNIDNKFAYVDEILNNLHDSQNRRLLKVFLDKDLTMIQEYEVELNLPVEKETLPKDKKPPRNPDNAQTID